MAVILFVLFMVIFTRLGWWVYERAGQPLDLTSFFLGIILTMLAAFLVFRLQEWYTTATRPARPQSVSAQTKDTPSQITRAALGAIFFMFLTIAGMVFVAYVAVFVLE